MKKKLRLLSFFFSVLLFFVFTSCKTTPPSDSTNGGDTPPVEYVGTWETAKNLIVGTSNITLKIDASGNVTYISKTDMTRFIDEFRASRKEKGIMYPEPDTWEATELNPLKTYDISTGGLSKAPKVNFSSSRPFVINIEDVTNYESLKSSALTHLEVSEDEKILTMTITDESDKIRFTKK